MFVQIIEAKTSDPAALRQRIDTWQKDVMPGAVGFLGSTGGVTEDGTFFTIARFDSAAQAQRNSSRPEQDAWWRGTEPLLRDVTFRESEDVDTVRAGGSDVAGFVQVIEGRATDRAAIAGFEQEMEQRFQEMRPDFIGGVRAWLPGDEVVQVAYFTSEQEARTGESAPPPADVEQAMRRWRESMTDVRYLDIRQPWLISG